MSVAPSPEASSALAAVGRASALAAVLPVGGHPAAEGMADPAVLAAEGPDAARFLHSQLTSDVLALEPGAGQRSARVTRTGHLVASFSLHRRADAPEGAPRLAILVEAGLAPALRDDLEAFLFGDRCTLYQESPVAWLVVQGPRAPEVLDAVLGPAGFEPWSTLPEDSLRPVRRARGGLAVPEGAWAVRRSLGGDPGFLVAWPGPVEAVAAALEAAVSAVGGALVDPPAFSAALDVLRVEAGIPRVGPDTAGKRRLLPETGLEQATVSYTKGCYLGQEVIARVRTYGSVPHLLRALVIDGALEDLPDPGADLVTEEGVRVGQIASRALSPVVGGPVALAYLAREHRTPGLRLRLNGPRGPFGATVAVLPLYSAPDAAARVRQLYDQAVRTFAEGEVDGAIRLLEAALRLDPSFSDVFEALGVIFGRTGRFHEAIDVFRRLEEVAPDEPIVNTNLSLYYMKLGDKPTAEDEAARATVKTMTRAAGKDATKVDADLDASRRKDAARKKTMFERVLQIDPVDTVALFGLGSALLTLGDAEGAATWLARATEVDRSNSAVYAARGQALERLERWDEAVAVYRAGVEVASRKGDLMPLKAMEHRLLLLGGR